MYLGVTPNTKGCSVSDSLLCVLYNPLIGFFALIIAFGKAHLARHCAR